MGRDPDREPPSCFLKPADAAVDSGRTLPYPPLTEKLLHYGFATVEPTGRPYGYPRRNAFRQPVLEQQLRDALGRFSHVEALYGWSLDRYGADTDAVTLDLTGPDGEPRRIGAGTLSAAMALPAACASSKACNSRGQRSTSVG